MVPWPSSRNVAGMLLMPYFTASLFSQTSPSKYCGPGHVLLFSEARQLLFLFVQADADDLETLLVIGLVGLDHVGQFADARPAPGRPKVEQHDLPFVIGDGKRLARSVLHIEIGELGPFCQGGLNLLRLGRFLIEARTLSAFWAGLVSG